MDLEKSSNRKKLSAVIACYRDAQAIPIMYERLKDVFKQLNVSYEMIFVNDCSPDNTSEILEEMAKKDKHVVVISHTRNFGSQNAFTSGMRIATGDAIILLDGDLQDPPEIIEDFYNKWQEGFEVVYGIRVKREATWFMQVAYKLFYRIFRAVSYINIPSNAGDFSLLDRRVVETLNNLPENNRFIRGLRAWVGYRQTGVPYVRPERVFGHSTNSLIKYMGWARKAIFSFSYLPLDLIAWLAFFIVAISMIAIVIQVIYRLLYPGMTPSGITTVIVLILLIGGVQLLCISIIGSYLAHIYDEVKRRPPYIVREIRNDPRETHSK